MRGGLERRNFDLNYLKFPEMWSNPLLVAVGIQLGVYSTLLSNPRLVILEAKY